MQLCRVSPCTPAYAASQPQRILRAKAPCRRPPNLKLSVYRSRIQGLGSQICGLGSQIRAPGSMACAPRSVACAPGSVAWVPGSVAWAPRSMAWAPGSVAWAPGSVAGVLGSHIFGIYGISCICMGDPRLRTYAQLRVTGHFQALYTSKQIAQITEDR